MHLPVRAAMLALVVVGTGCGSGGLSAEDRRARCAEFAKAVAPAKLTGTPSEQLAKQVADGLDGLLPRMSAPDLHGPAIEVHQDLHRVEKFARRGDTTRADRAAADAREHLRQLATACELPVDQFLKG